MSSIKDTVNGCEDKNKIIPGMLYLVATPIGNLADLSPRALKVLEGVDFIAAEDTRNTAGLLTRFSIRKELVSYFEHNKRERGELILTRLLSGQSCALVTDAGTPAISDPGEDLVRLCAERGVLVTSIPGCCALTSALALSALATGRFAFEGFLSTNAGERKKRFAEIVNEHRTLIFYEAPHKLRGTLRDLLAAFGNRKVALCRELTKLNEEILRGTLEEVIKLYTEREPRGEYVIVLEGLDEFYHGNPPSDAPAELLALSPKEHVQHYLDEGMERMDAIKAAAKDRNLSKSAFYAMLNEAKKI